MFLTPNSASAFYCCFLPLVLRFVSVLLRLLAALILLEVLWRKISVEDIWWVMKYFKFFKTGNLIRWLEDNVTNSKSLSNQFVNFVSSVTNNIDYWIQCFLHCFEEHLLGNRCCWWSLLTTLPYWRLEFKWRMYNFWQFT